jgi:hypothetical protein
LAEVRLIVIKARLSRFDYRGVKESVERRIAG